MNINKTINIISCGCGDQLLNDQNKNILQKSSVIISSKTLLNNILLTEFIAKNDLTLRCVILDKNSVTTLENELTVDNITKENIVILGSGDVLFNGIANTVLKITNGIANNNNDKIIVNITPNITAFQNLSAKCNFDWSNADLVSIHGHNSKNEIPWLKILDGRTKIIYCDYKCTASDLAKLLIEKFPECQQRQAIAAENLNFKEICTKNEKICTAPLSAIATENFGSLSILIIKETTIYSEKKTIILGLSDEEYHHENNLITHSEVRAVALSKLRLAKGGATMWDLGAGSGSVGIEAKLLCAGDLNLYSVEKNSKRCELIEQNINKFGIVSNVKNNNISEIINDNILTAIENLPNPDMVYIGGGGHDICKIVNKTFAKLNNGGIIVVATVTIETMAKVSTLLQNNVEEIVTLNIAKNRCIAKVNLNMMQAMNPITLFVFKK